MARKRTKAGAIFKDPRIRNIGSVGFGVTFEGDWMKTQAIIDATPGIIRAGFIAGQESAAKKLLTIVKHHIKSGVPGWPTLSQSHKDFKSRKGYSEGIYQMTGAYKQAIKKWRKGDQIYVGIKTGVPHPTSKLTLSTLAIILEFGSQGRVKIPRRPLWGPSFKTLGGNKRIRQLILWHIKLGYRTRFGISPKMTL